MKTSNKTLHQHLTGVERNFNDDEIIVSKTDARGIMVYANNVFLSISGYAEDELIGKPHSVIRHPHMPRCIFKLLWDTIKAGNEVFAYVMNRCKNGDHYWVFAHVTPTMGRQGEIVGYHSSRRVARREALDIIIPLYARLLEIEEQHDGRTGLEQSSLCLNDLLKKKGLAYDQFIINLQTV